ncbi:M20/M25/M40 family metallo-hydrolase [Polaromonas sp.]|uniref:M20/M25/M40 family metallo-hydrolase n=1 Tax=Polaromonas sp. TaxID=1869339 RepID=UPI0032655EE0
MRTATRLARLLTPCLLLAGLLLGLHASHAQTSAQLDPQLPALAEQEAPAVLDTLRDLTSVDSGTGQAAGMSAVATQIENFAKGLGAQVERITPASGVAGPNLVITFKGIGKRKIMLISHMDTVYVAGTAAARPFRRDGNRAIAPGIADDKGGVAVFLHAMKLLKARGFQDYERVTMVFNSDEERGSAGSRDLIRSQAQGHDVVLSGEPTGEREGIVLATSGVGQMTARLKVGGPFASADARPIEELADLILRAKDAQQRVAGTRMNWTVARAEDPRAIDKLAPGGQRYTTLNFRIVGRASHAGVNPALGINAVVEMADLIRRTTETAATQTGARLHWRSAGGGLVSNIIADRAQAVAELALPASADPAPVLEALTQIAKRALLPGAQISAETSDGLTTQQSGAGEAYASADMRVPDAPTFETLRQAARQLIQRQKFASSSISVQDGLGFPAYNASEEGRRLAGTAQEIYAALGGKLELVPRTYGGTDAVWASQSGKPVVEGFGLPGGNYHSSEEEFVLIDRIPRRLLLAAEMIRALSRL